jgi:GMP reductase
MHIGTTLKYDFDSVLIRPKRSTLKSRSEVDITREFKFKWSPISYQGIPIIAANMDSVGTVRMFQSLEKYRVSTAIHKHYDHDMLRNLFRRSDQSCLWYSLGISDTDLEKYSAIKADLRKSWIDVPEQSSGASPCDEFIEQPIQNICIDVANGYSQHFVDFVKRFREENPLATIMAGNVVTPEITEELILAGVDIVKVGIGPGSVCTTRIKTGVGFPQLSAIIECADAAHGLEGHICADGGCKTPGDVAKAFGGGADFVMLGGMLAGHDEGGGKVVGGTLRRRNYQIPEQHTVHFHNNYLPNYNYIVVLDGKQFTVSGEDLQVLEDRHSHIPESIEQELALKYPPLFERGGERFVEFYGMSSATAQEKYNGGVAEYRASEGKRVLIPYRGPVEGTIKEILGGVRSACTYVGARRLKEFSKRTTFVVVPATHNTVFGNDQSVIREQNTNK